MGATPSHRRVGAACCETRRQQAVQFVRTLGAAERALILAPSMGAASALVHDALQGRPSFGWQRHTLDSLALLLATLPLARRGLSPLHGMGVEAVCTRVVHELAAQGELGQLSPLADRPGLPRALSSSLLELRAAGVPPSRLRPLLPDLARVLEGYIQALADVGLTDRAGIFAAAAERVEQGDHELTGLPLLALDVPAHDRVAARLCTALWERAPRGLWTVARGDRRTEQLLGTVQVLPAARDNALRRAQGGLFSEGDAAPGELDESLGLLTSPGESRECAELARGIVDAARDGVPFDRMAILLRAPDNYRATLEEVLHRAGVPAYFARGVRRPQPAGRALLALLRCAEQGLSARAFAEYLSLGEVPRPDADVPVPSTDPRHPLREATQATSEVEPPPEAAFIAPRKWERWIVDAAVVGGVDRWRRRLAGLARGWLQTEGTLEPDDPRREHLRRDREQLQALRDFALPLIEQLDALPESATWGQWLPLLSELARRALGQPEAVVGALSELSPLSPVGPVGLREVRHVLERRLGEGLLGSAGWGEGQVFVGAVDDARGRSFERVFVPGLAERVFPQKVIEDPVLPDAVRRALGEELPVNESRVQLERLQLHLAVGASRGKLVLSYPSLDPERGRPRVPSFYGLEVLRAATGGVPDLDVLLKASSRGEASRMGWPAPADSQRAIDQAEFDLSMLGQWLKAEPGQAHGAARYLLDNEVLAQALRARAMRWAPTWSSADGLVARGGKKPVGLAERSPEARALSATALQHFASCPYRFYLYAVQGLDQREDPAGADQMDPRQRGELVHRAQRATLESLRQSGQLPVTHDNLSLAREHLDEQLQQLGEQAREQWAPSIERVFDDNLATIRADLRVWLERMADQRAWVPSHFELAFGVRRSEEVDLDSRQEPVALSAGLSLRGAIDLVERRVGQGKTILRATDHKTGKVPEQPGRLRGGRTLQPALYALALEQLFPDVQVEGGRLYYCTRRGGFEVQDVPLDPGTRAGVQQLADTLKAHFAQGFFPAAPMEDTTCARCAYQAVCGPYEWERVAGKDPAWLQKLTHLRRLV